MTAGRTTQREAAEPGLDPDVPTADQPWPRRMFALSLVVAAVVIWATSRHMWFHVDEWDFLVDRDAGDLDDLLGPTNLVHWTTVPLLVYRAIFAVVGLHHYLPYQLPAIVLHLLVAVLIRRVMLRSGVDPWIATAAATLFALFGAGHQNVFWAFQISFNGSLAMGLVHLELATHDGPVDRRDAGGLLAGVIGLMCSGLAVPMTLIVGLATLVGRGWRIAALHTVPLGVAYLLWWFGYVDRAEAADRDRGSPTEWLEFIWIGMRETFSSLGQIRGVGIVLAAVMLLGLTMAWRSARSPIERRQRLATPTSMLIGAIAFLWITAVGRVAAALGAFDVVLGPQLAEGSRYLHVVAALSLPAIAVGADELRRRWPSLAPAAVILFVVGIPGNIGEFVDPASPRLRETPQRVVRAQVLDLSVASLLELAPSDAVPVPSAAPMTVGWLRDQVAEGRVPDPGAIGAVRRANADAALAFVPTLERGADCVDLTATGTPDTFEAGQRLVFTAEAGTVVMLTYISPDGTEADPRPIPLDLVPGVEIVAPDATLRIDPDPDVRSVQRCR